MSPHTKRCADSGDSRETAPLIPARGARRPPLAMIVTDAYPPDCGGSGWSTHSLVTTLRDQGHTVRVVEVDRSTARNSSRTYDGFDVRTVGLGAERSKLSRRLGGPDFTYRALRAALASILEEEPEIDLLHAQHLHSGPASVAAAIHAGRGALVTIRDHWPVCLHGTTWWGDQRCSGCTARNLVGCMNENYRLPRPLALGLVPWARRRMSTRRAQIAPAKLIAVSETMRALVAPQMALQATGLPDVDLRVVANIVDPEQTAATAATSVAAGLAATAEALGARHPGRYLLAAGKISSAKGFDRMIATLAEARSLRSNLPCLPLVVTGRGPLRDRLERDAIAAGLDVVWLDWADHDRLLALMQGAAAVLLPSALEEALSRVMLESMSLGTPVVAWATGSSREVIRHGDNGWLVDSAADLAAALDALSSIDERNRAGGNALQTVRDSFAPDRVYPQILQAYDDALAAVGRAQSSRGEQGG